MSKPNQTPNRKAASLLILIGALLMSSFPGVNSQAANGSMDLSSTKKCGISDQLERDGTAECKEIKQFTAIGIVKFEDLKVEKITEPGSDNELPTYKVKGSVVRDCYMNCEDGVTETSFEKTVSAIDDISKVIKEGIDEAAEEGREEKKMAAKQKVLEQAIERCDLPDDATIADLESTGLDDNEGFESDDEATESSGLDYTAKMQCRIGKLRGMSGKAALNYYQQNVHGELQGLLMSSNLEEFQLGQQLLGEANQTLNVGQCANPMAAAQEQTSGSVIFSASQSAAPTSDTRSNVAKVKGAICDLNHFTGMKLDLAKLEQDLKSPDPRRREAAEKAIPLAQQSVSNYFSGKAGTIGAAEQSTHIDGLFGAIVENHRKMLQVATDAAGSTTTTTNTNTTRGMAPRGGVLPVNPEQGNRPVQLQIPAAPPAMPTAPRGNGFQPAPPIGSAVNGGALPARPANNGGQVRIR